ncbi:MAG: hypothetical protein R2844_10555 [Caldilineales bacterium]
MKRTLFLAAGVLAALILIFTGQAGAQSLGPVSASLSIPEGDYTVGDRIPVTVAVTHPAGYYVVMPTLPTDQPWGDFTVAGQTQPVTVASQDGDGSETTSVVIDARLFKPGSFTTPPVEIAVTDGAGSLQTVTAAPATVALASVLQAGDSDLRDIKGQASLPLPAIWPWVALALVIGALAGLAVTWWRRRTVAAVDNRLPHEKALDALAGIEAMHLPEQGRFKEHYTLVSDTVRIYIERRFGVPATERTTGEIRTGLRRTDMAEDVKAQLVLFLQDSDLIKFSTYRPDAESAAYLLATARFIVEATRQQPAVEDDSAANPPASRRGTRRHAQPSEVPA